MSHITLIRHGQANSGAKDEVSYDRLSDLGHEQAAWLGHYLREAGSHHTRLFTGTLIRHRETADGMATGLVAKRDARLNELEYFTLATLLEEQHGVPFPTEQGSFTSHLPTVFEYWKSGKLEGAPETWQHFHDRIESALRDIAAGDGPALVVTSGGLISMVMAQAMGLSVPAMARMALAIMHTSMHRLFPIGGHWSPVLFNAVPHLETPDRRLAQTHI
ncbi:histidine phosphatase family protein [Sulfitobacter mediterraneus]|uniref:histidine phosphatase family protein n=1 Tax=Sulfitobacter mediterraneus TaxID=83219 RepID=UPI0019313E5C|nr:histidine phosphatase family protein [Sulfitobacter mediterraneus]MBM1632616.1 histidine phosphatase family protein [Sulfitobacter mediterraneus]MBM1641250.1 histidine phosphatase family protein [Sulfitobacter mediterraneus]MBM1644481.1 histidine phosphatase family protein [Sulfitobacter mediterraneus]MBM1649370.1 histidine phosphatase family protein [Sulfitobacter mediterraneus]MBM1653391.1 histidine phosphatase family protein [Sulfitobacter mediterraneus]